MKTQFAVRVTIFSAVFAFGVGFTAHAQQPLEVSSTPVVATVPTWDMASASKVEATLVFTGRNVEAPKVGDSVWIKAQKESALPETSAEIRVIPCALLNERENTPPRHPKAATAMAIADEVVPAKAKGKKKKAAKEVKRPQFIQIAENADGEPVSLDTSIVTYKNKDGVKVALIGALHIGEKEYYEDLNKEFRRYDTVLYELVAKKGTRVPKGGGKSSGRSPLSALQGGMKNMLGLAFQLEEVDYTKKNLVHADLSPEEFAKSMDEKGESFLKMYFRMLGHGMAQQSKGQSTEMDMLMSFFSSDREARKYNLRKAMAGQFEDVESSMAAIEGEEGSTIIRARNFAALKVLKEQIAKGDKKVGVFYGAGHLPHMHDVLVNDFNMKVVRTRWLKSWRLAAPAETKEAKAADE